MIHILNFPIDESERLKYCKGELLGSGAYGKVY